MAKCLASPPLVAVCCPGCKLTNIATLGSGLENIAVMTARWRAPVGGRCRVGHFAWVARIAACGQIYPRTVEPRAPRAPMPGSKPDR